MDLSPIPERRVAIGVDLGQSRDPTTIAVVERERLILPPHVVEAMSVSGSRRRRLTEIQAELPKPTFNLRILEQAPLGEAYPAQALRIQRIQANPRLADRRVPLYIDYTGVGRAVFEIFKGAGLTKLTGVTLTFNGQDGPNAQGGLSLSKLSLVSRINAVMHSGRLKVPAKLPLMGTFHRELQDFRVSYTAAGNATFNAMEGRHDDTLTAVGLALYALDRTTFGAIHMPFAA